MNARRQMWGGGLAQRTTWLIGLVIVFGALPMLADRYFYDHWHYKNVYDQDWARLLRVMGFAPTWGIAALVLWLHERSDEVQRAAARAWYLITAMLAGGLLAEIMKLLLRRERPWEELAGAHPLDFTIANAPERLARTGDRWRDVLQRKQSLERALARTTS